MSALITALEQRLRWAGFRSLSAAECSAGPFARPRGELRCLRLDEVAFNVASLSPLDSARDMVRVVEELNWDYLPYDLNIAGQAHRIEVINEFIFLCGGTQDVPSAELVWRGYQRQGACWLRAEKQYMLPTPSPDFGGEIFPCLGWVPLSDEPAEFRPAEQRRGFCSKRVPPGASAIRDTRGYSFIHGGYRERPVLRRQIIAFFGEGATDLSVIVDDAIGLSYATP